MKTRREFLNSSATLISFIGLRKYITSVPTQKVSPGAGHGPLVRDEKKVVELPAGFDYQVISRAGERMNDGFFVPAAHDGMAAFPGPNGTTVLVRNHELDLNMLAEGPFGPGAELRSRLDSSLIYDQAPGPGGTTTLVYDTRRKTLERQSLSLTGTIRNCAGGPTPWGSWISCEETVQLADARHKQNHGYNFEVPAMADGVVTPTPLKAMGRFYHEAIAVDAQTGIVYQTEDRDDSLLYRFIPERRGDLASGGQLQALAIRDLPSADMRNWMAQSIPVGRTFEADWIDLDDVQSPKDDLRVRGFAAGAARFARGEGMWAGQGVIYFACTSGGSSKAGQIWKYVPDANGGKLQLFIEPNDTSVLEMADNITVAPWGDLIICEDGPNGNHVLGVTPQGRLYQLARNVMNTSEFAGAVFSPDGSTLFVNIQTPGLTLAITGPWRR